MKLHLDFETRSTVDIKKAGAWAYAMHPSTEITCLAFGAQGPTSVQVLRGRDIGYDWTKFQIGHIGTGVIAAHSVHFEFAIYNYILHKRFGWPARWDPKMWDCTLARAAMCNLPQSLENCANALNLDVKKDMVGKQAMLKLCKPIGFDPLTNAPIYNEDPKLHADQGAYCADDVRAEMGIDARLPELSAQERLVFELDLIMNHRGVLLDTALARKASGMVASLTEDLNVRLKELTNGFVDKATKVARLREWLKANGVATDNLDKGTVDRILKDPKISAAAKAVVNIRRQVGKTSTSKYNAILDVASPVDSRARGLIQYHGASTGRFAGRLVQPHNFPKGVTEDEQAAIITSIEDDSVSLLYGDGGMDALSNALRGTIIAPEGKMLVAADYNAIEPRVLFWLAGEEEALESYRRGGSPYLDMGAYLYKKPITKKDAQEYAVSKMTILGAGFGMGAERFQAQCASAQPKPVYVSEKEAIEAIKAYREKYQLVVQMWYAMENAAKSAIRIPGSRHEVCGGRVVWGLDAKKEFLVCKLPSGRHLRYYHPSLVKVWVTFCEDKECEHQTKGIDYCPHKQHREEIHFWSPGLGGALAPQSTYGGSLVENVVQATARDILVHGMLNVEGAGGLDNVLNVHDEIVAEVKLAGRDAYVDPLGYVIGLMCQLPAWAAGCPVAAEGFVARRYRK